MIHFVVGTRAQLLKLAPVMLACESAGLAWRWVYTAQHREKIQHTIDDFELPGPSYVVVEWDSEARSFGEMAYWLTRMGLALPRSSSILAGRTGRRHIVVTHGDTFTTWLGATIGKLSRTPVLHVEAGLRSFHLLHPFPEELNRLITFRLADFYACPNEWAVANLRTYKGEKLNTGGNTQLDTLRFGVQRSTFAAVDLPSAAYIVASIHRYENIFRATRLEAIVKAVELVSERFHVLFIQHPATALQLEKLGKRGRLLANERVTLIPRLEYPAFIKAVMGSEFVITDGGGNQEELSYLGKPTLILREETERREGIGENACLSGLELRSIRAFIDDYARYRRSPAISDQSPSRVIAEWLGKHGFGA